MRQGDKLKNHLLSLNLYENKVVIINL